MKYFSRTFIFLILIHIVACTRDEALKKETRRLSVKKTEAVFYNPSPTTDDSLRKALGDRYFSTRDSLTESNYRLIRLFDSLNIPHRHSDADVIEFVESAGIKTVFETQKLAAPWGVIYFESGMPPINLTTNYQENIRLLRTVIPGFILAPATTVQDRSAVVKNRTVPKDIPVIEEALPQPTRDYLSINQLRLIEKGLPADTSERTIYNENIEELFPGDFNRISQIPLLNVKFDNDIFDNTDIYYTNGVRIEHLAPVWRHSPISHLLISPSKKGETHYGLSLVQNIYTPQFPVREDIQYGDRPFAAYLYVGHISIYNNPAKKIRLTNEIDLGVIGEASLGGSIQSYLHGEEKRPKGWKNQIVNDLIANFNVNFEKGLIENQGHEFIATSAIQAGTLYTSGGIGVKYQWGNRKPYFSSYYNVPQHFSPKQPWHSYFTYQFGFQTDIMAIAYDATLQGGLFNHSSPYTISDVDLKRMIWNGEASFSISYKRYTTAFIQHITSPEFTNMRWHKWGRIRLTIPL